MSQALKIMMNSIYGLFGSNGIFEFQDYRVAELVTVFARLKLLEMKQLAIEKFEMNIIYGDTDSIFISSINEQHLHILTDSFIVSCKETLGIDVDHQNTFVRSILLGKKRYIGIQPDGKVIIKGMEGKNRDRPTFFSQVFTQLIDDYKNNSRDLTSNILAAFGQLEAAEVDPGQLAYSLILNKDPSDYQRYTPQYKIGSSTNKESGSLIRYYKTGEQEDGYKGYSTNYQDLNIDVYKQELWRVLKEVLKSLGHDVQKLEDQIFIERKQNDTGIILPENNNEVTRRRQKSIRKSDSIQRNESLDDFYLRLRILNATSIAIDSIA